VSKILDKAGKQVAAGSYEKAMATLWTAEARLRLETHGKTRDLEDAHALRDLALAIGEQLDESPLRDECRRLVGDADAAIAELVDPGGRLRKRVGRLAVSFPRSHFVGFSRTFKADREVRPRTAWMWFAATWIGVGSHQGEPAPGEHVPTESVECVELGGGKVSASAGGPFVSSLLYGDAVGIAELVMPDYRTDVIVRTHSGDAALFAVEDQKPASVRAAVAPLLASLGIPFTGEPLSEARRGDSSQAAAQATSADAAATLGAAATATDAAATRDAAATQATAASQIEIVNAIARLHDLYEEGALTDEEYATLKANLLG
jgi:hypothetical protein